MLAEQKSPPGWKIKYAAIALAVFPRASASLAVWENAVQALIFGGIGYDFCVTQETVDDTPSWFADVTAGRCQERQERTGYPRQSSRGLDHERNRTDTCTLVG
jgi:hypothetical protein